MVQKYAKLFLMLTAVVLVFTACTKKPKIDLSGLREAPAGSGALTRAGSGPDFIGGGDIPVFDGGPSTGDFFGDDGAALAGSGEWTDTGQALDAGALGALQNTSAWHDVVYFAYDRSEVLPSERPKLDALAQTLLDTPAQSLVIEGHCDERGSDEYNRALSERRALSVREYLHTLGIASDRMQTVSYGEDRPVVPNATSEADHQKNRRAEFLLGTR